MSLTRIPTIEVTANPTELYTERSGDKSIVITAVLKGEYGAPEGGVTVHLRL